MAKKILIFLLAVILVACLASCGEKGEVYTVTLNDNGNETIITITNGVPSQQLPESAELPADKAEYYIFSHWYYINPQNGAEKKVTDTDSLKSIKQDVTLLPKFVEILEVTYVKDEGGYVIDGLGKKGVMQTLVIPEVYNGSKGEYPIVGVSNEAFKGEEALVSVTFKGSVKKVGNNAFDGCTSLQTVTFEKTGLDISKLGKNIFRKVEGITEITGAAELVSQITNASKLTKVKITEGKIIKDSCFKNAELLASVEIAEGVTTIGDAAFKGCSKLTAIKIPSTVSYIGIDSFVNCVKLESIQVAGGNSYYTSGYNGNYIMANNQEYVDAMGKTVVREHVLIVACKNTVLDDNIEYIDQYAFNGVSGLKSLYIGRNVISIHENAFVGCSNIASIVVNDSNRYYTDGNASNCLVKTDSGMLIIGGSGKVVIPNFVTSISSTAFANCTELKSVTIPASVSTILSGTFANCEKLESVVIAADSKNLIIEDGAFDKTAIKNIELPTEYVSYFVSLASKTLKTAHVNAGDNVASAAFKNCTVLSAVILSDSITAINDSAFEGCAALSTVECGDSLEIVGYSAFKDCRSLTKLGTSESTGFHLKSTITVGDSAFENTGITELKIDTRDSLGYRVFANCQKLDTLEIGEDIFIDYDAFVGCANIKTAVLPADAIVRSLRDSKEIETLTITSGVIEAFAFKDCELLTSLTIGKDVTEVQARAFEGCISLSELVVSEENELFTVDSGCLVLDGVVILGSCEADLTKFETPVTKIASYAFSGIGVSKVEISETLEVDAYAFFNCRELTDITIKSLDANNINKYAFDGCNGVTTADITTFFIDKLNWSALQTLTISSGDLIPEESFRDCVTLRSVKIVSSDTVIGDRAFAGCINLNNISVHKISDLAGFDCENIRFLTILNVSGSLEAGALAGFTNLEKVVIKPGEFTVSGNPFSEDASIYTLEAPAAVIAAIDSKVLNTVNTLVVNSGNLNVSGLEFKSLKKLVISGADTLINAISFTKAPVLAEISISVEDGADHASYTVLGNALVSGNVLVLGAKDATIDADVIDVIGEYAFSGREIESIKIPAGISTIENNAFSNCTKLTYCEVSENISIGNEAFSFCTKLESVVLCDGVTIESDANPFLGCFGIKELSTSAQVLNQGAISLDSVVTLTVTGGEWTVIANAPRLVTLNINAGVTIVPNAAGLITGLNNIKEINVVNNSDYTVVNGCLLTDGGKTLVLGTNEAVIPDSVTKIAAYAFKGCSELKSVNIPASVSVIEPNAFYGCVSLVEITVESANTVYAGVNNAVLGKDLTTLYIGCAGTTIADTVTAIDAYAFSGSGITGIVIPNSVTSIGVGAFNSCESLTKVVFTEGSKISRIEASVFSRCTKLAKIVIPVSVEFIDSSAFSGCRNVTAYYCGASKDAFNAIRKFAQGSDVEITKILILDKNWYYYNGNDIREI